MKNTAVTAVLCLAIGFAIAWFIKPSSDSETTSTDDSSEVRKARKSSRTPSVGDGTRSVRKKGRKASSDDSEMSPEMTRAMQEEEDRQTKQFRKAMGKRFDRRIAAMVKELELNPEQEKQLREFFDRQLELLQVDDPEELINKPEELKKMADALRGAGLTEHMKQFLSDDQLAGLEAMEKRKHKNKIEGRAMKDLAKLQQNLDLSEEQKDKVYGVLLKDAEHSVDNQSDADFLMRGYMEGMGIGIDLGEEDLGMLMKVQSIEEDANPLEVIKEIQQERQKKIDQRVQNMSSVLQGDQLKQYRSHLENQGGMLKMMMQGLEDS